MRSYVQGVSRHPYTQSATLLCLREFGKSTGDQHSKARHFLSKRIQCENASLLQACVQCGARHHELGKVSTARSARVNLPLRAPRGKIRMHSDITQGHCFSHVSEIGRQVAMRFQCKWSGNVEHMRVLAESETDETTGLLDVQCQKELSCACKQPSTRCRC